MASHDHTPADLLAVFQIIQAFAGGAFPGDTPVELSIKFATGKQFVSPLPAGCPVANEHGRGVHRSAPAPSFHHSEDFRNVIWCGQRYSFTATQAPAVRLLWEAWESGTHDVPHADLLRATGTANTRLVDVFRGHSAWQHIIVTGDNRGVYRLAEPVDDDTPSDT